MWGDLCIDPMNREVDSLRRDLMTLSKRIEALEEQYSCSLCELKNYLHENNSELISLRKELEIVKGQQCELPRDLLEKIDAQQRSLADSKELEQIQINYGNNPDGMSTLHYAIKEGNINAVSLLLANGADVNSVNFDPISFSVHTPICALSRTAICNQIELAQILLNLGADINFLFCKDGKDNFYSFYPIKYAAEFASGDLVTLFIEKGALLDRVQYHTNGDWYRPETPLHVAAKAGNYQAIVALVGGGADIDGRIPNPADPHGVCKVTPLELAANHLKYSDNPQNLELVKFLVANGATRRINRYHEDQYGGGICPVISGYLKSVGK